MIPMVNLKTQYYSIKNDIDRAIENVLKSGWFVLGKELEAFEVEFAAYCQSHFGVGVGSGTEAIHLALLACGIKPGDEVITAPNTAVAVACAISFANANPVFVDIEPDTYMIDARRIEKAITKRTRAIIPVHLFGHPADMEPILDIAKRFNLKVIEDASHAHGAEYKGRKVGSIGDAGCFSFYPTKNLGCYGDGGMVVTNDEELAERLRLFRNYGEDSKFHSKIKGFNSRLDEIQSAILRVKLKRLDEWNEKRQRIAFLYGRLLANEHIKIPLSKSFVKHVYHQYVIRLRERDELKKYLDSEGIETSIHYPVPIHLQKAYADASISNNDLAISESYAKEILSLPIHPEMSEEDVVKITEAVNNFTAGRK
ncbi:MAG: DegT/DnrJ/EryC1/StrS family aminotransferase [Candidatus Omnitrophica bacterium]|nr:DegT/DnrJ/EryC1/StrS family aminotransferase [Candidatus Omnitrophota bacterium]